MPLNLFNSFGTEGSIEQREVTRQEMGSPINNHNPQPLLQSPVNEDIRTQQGKRNRETGREYSDSQCKKFAHESKNIEYTWPSPFPTPIPISITPGASLIPRPDFTLQFSGSTEASHASPLPGLSKLPKEPFITREAKLEEGPVRLKNDIRRSVAIREVDGHRVWFYNGYLYGTTPPKKGNFHYVYAFEDENYEITLHRRDDTTVRVKLGDIVLKSPNLETQKAKDRFDQFGMNLTDRKEIEAYEHLKTVSRVVPHIMLMPKLLKLLVRLCQKMIL